jgi:hypothetical protein
VPAVAELGAVGRAHPQGGELRPERSLGAAAPGDAAPSGARQGQLGRDRVLAGTGSSLGTGCLRGRPARATGQRSPTAGG